MSYTLVLEWMPGDLYMSAVTARCTAPTSSYSVVWLPPNKVYQITLYCGSTSLVSFLVGAFRGKAWSYMKKKPSHPMLRKYTVTIEEHIAQEFPVKAYDLSHALETAEAAYKQGKFVILPSAPITRLIMARHNKTGKTTGWREF